MEISFRSCGTCTACCSGALSGNSYGNAFHKGKPCVFLSSSGCNIYDTRPDTCRNYQCAWSQGILPEWLNPIVSNVLISVEIKDSKQFLKVISLKGEIDTKITTFLDEWTTDNNTYYTVIKDEN